MSTDFPSAGQQEALEHSPENHAKKVNAYVWNSGSGVWERMSQPGLNIPKHDEVVLTYVTSGNGVGEIETAVYKLATVTVATLTLSYNSDDKLSGVVKS